MKTILKLLFIVISIFFASAAMAQEKKVVYTCPMHPEVQMEKPGNCPKCGMTLVKKTITVKTPASQPKKKQNKKPASKATNKMPDTMPMSDTSKSMHHQHMDMPMKADTAKPK